MSSGSFEHMICPACCRVAEGRASARAQHQREARETKTTQVITRLATVDHDRQGQATHRQYKSHTAVEFASGS